MTSRERMEKVLKHLEPDRTPIFEYVLSSPVADMILGRPYVDYAFDYEGWLDYAREKGWENAIRQYVRDRLDIADRLGHDMLYIMPNPTPGRVEDGAAVSEEPCPCDDPVERVAWRNKKKETTGTVWTEEDAFAVYRFIREEMKIRGMDLPILAPACYHGIWTDVDLMETMIIEPEVAEEHFRIATGIALGLVEKYLALGIEQISVGGDFAGNRLLISPENYRCFIVPQVKILSDRIHAAGSWSINASDGNLWEVIDDYLIGCDVDGYIEIDMRAGMDLKELKDRYGHKITLYGNMDCGEILSFCTPDEIRRYTVECIEKGAGDGGHVFCASNAITSSVTLKNYLTMLNAYREVFGLTAVKIG